MKNFWKIGSYILVAMVASLVTLLLCTDSWRVGSAAQTQMDKLQQLQALIENRFIGEADPVTLGDAAAKAMVSATGDRWSHYIPASELQSYMENMHNAYVGVGITIADREDDLGLDIQKVTAGGPAEEAGIRAGDILNRVGGELISALGKEEAKNRIRGEAGTRVNLTVLRDGKELSFDVERRAIKTPVAKATLLPDGIGLIKIENFNDNCASEVIAAITELRSQGAKALIFDVRFNPGGYRHELVALLDYLLPEGELFHSEEYDGTKDVDHSDASFLDMPMAVLVNGDSYSAAEFFAAALSEYEAAVVVGQKTVGKGYYQQTFKLSDGSAVALSVGKYFTPKGVSLAGVGITPDIPVEVDSDTYVEIYLEKLAYENDPQVQAAVNALLGK